MKKIAVNLLSFVTGIVVMIVTSKILSIILMQIIKIKIIYNLLVNIPILYTLLMASYNAATIVFGMIAAKLVCDYVKSYWGYISLGIATVAIYIFTLFLVVVSGNFTLGMLFMPGFSIGAVFLCFIKQRTRKTKNISNTDIINSTKDISNTDIINSTKDEKVTPQ